MRANLAQQGASTPPDCGGRAYWYAAAGLGIGVIIGAMGAASFYLAGKFF